MLHLFGLLCLTLAAGYAVTALVASLLFARRRPPAPALAPACTILKPLYGAEPGLLERLRTYCVQEGAGEVQILCGVRDAADPALGAVAALRREFPSVAIEVVVDGRLHGANRKVSNLINMEPHARHETLVLADSDTAVGSDYLRSVTAPLARPGVGLVTCLYRDVPTPDVWSRLGAMYINDWYMPTVKLAWLFGHRGYVSGQTLCLTRATLAACGGFAALRDHLADDHRLGELVRARGLSIALSRYPVTASHHEPGPGALIGHELRWLRTIRVLNPAGYAGLFVSFGLPLTLLGGLALWLDGSGSDAAAGLALLFATARLALHLLARPDRRAWFADLWLVPVRDLLLGALWLASFAGSTVVWGAQHYRVGRDGILTDAPARSRSRP